MLQRHNEISHYFMRNYILLILLIFSISFNTFAENVESNNYPKVSNFEASLSYGGAETAKRFDLDLGLQLRNNINNSPWSYGGYLGIMLPLRD